MRLNKQPNHFTVTQGKYLKYELKIKSSRTVKFESINVMQYCSSLDYNPTR